MSDANALIMGNSVPSATFKQPGIEHKGIITALDTMQVRNFKTKLPETWDDGNPKMQAVITLRTDERDESIENDNGVRRLFVGSKGMREAIAAAVKKSGAPGLAVGGKIGVKFTREAEGENGLNPSKVYAAKYEPPPAGAVDDEYEEPGEYDDYGEEPF